MGRHGKRKLKPTDGGVYIIVIVGCLLLFELDLDWGTTGNFVFAAIVIVGTASLAWLTRRFIAKHGDEIGEARFPQDERPKQKRSD